MIKKRSLILFCFLLNSGCFLFEKSYTRPHVQVPKVWDNSNHIKANPAVDLPALSWWKQFHRPELDGMIQKALAKNTQLKSAIANIEFAHSQLEEIKLSWLPSLAVLGGFSQFPILGNPGRFVLAYPSYIINILQLYQQQKSATALLEASIYAKDSVKLVVIAQVVASYFTLSAQYEMLHLIHQLLKDEKELLTLARSQYQHGLIAQDRIDQLESQVQQIKSQVALIQHNIDVSSNALHYLFNENPGKIRLEGSFKTLDSNAVIPGNIPVSVLSGRPDIHEAEAVLRAAHADVGAVASTLLPTVSLGSYLGTGSNPGSIRLNQAMLTMPIVDLPIFAQIGASKARYRMFCIHYIDTIRKALRDVSNDFSAYVALSTQLTNNTVAYRDEARHCRSERQRYRNGLVEYMSVMECQVKLDQFAMMLNQNKLEKMLAIVTLFQDLAGGYHGH